MAVHVDTGSCAFAAIKKHIVKLNRSVTQGQIPENLYSADLIDEDAWEFYINPTHIDLDKGKRIVRAVQKIIRIAPIKMMINFLEILKNEKATEDLARDINETYEAKKSEAAETSQSKFEQDFQSLKEDLEQFKQVLAQPDSPQSELESVIKFKITTFIKTSIDDSVPKMDVYNRVSTLCYETFTIPQNLCTWAIETVEKTQTPKPEPGGNEGTADEVTKDKSPSEPLPPLPSRELKELLYHSSLCCQAASTCTVANYRQFFSDNPHMFEQISMSISEDKEEVDRYLIAIQGQTIYVAFQSESSIQTWMKKYSSFGEGLEKQAGRIPFVFFWERLREHKRIVLTGFSYGGMLACYVGAILWKEGCIPIETLEKNVVCITYGQPVITIPCVQQVIKDIPHFQDTVYCVFKKKDVFPTALRYFNCIPHTNQGGMTSLSPSASKPSPTSSINPGVSHSVGTDQAFEEHGASQQFLISLSQLCNSEVSYSNVASGETQPDRSMLKSLSQNFIDSLPLANKPDEALLCGRYCYQIVEKEGETTWTEIPTKDLASLMLGCIPKMAIDSLDTTNFWKHKMKEYHSKMLKAFTQKEPDKFIVDKSQHFTQVSHLKPDVKSVSVHFFPNEHAVVLTGENLCFCNEVQLGEESNTLKIKSPDLLTPRIIQFNFPPDKKTRNVNISKGGDMKVTLRSHFSSPIRRRIKVDKESFTFSLREIQIAKYSPKEVIRLAFMSAMLERYSTQLSGRGPSKRLKDITQFLEEAVKVVPLESILFAVAYMDDRTSVDCARAVFESHFKLPPSEAMCAAARIASIRMMTGVPGAIVERYILEAIRRAMLAGVPSKMGRYGLEISYPDQFTLQLSVLSPSPATYAEALARHIQQGFSLLRPVYRPLPGIDMRIDLDQLHIPRSKKMYKDLARFLENIIPEGTNLSLDQLSNLSIEHIYPVSSQRRHSTALPIFQSPLEILQNARESLETFIEENSQEDLDSSQHFTNERMLTLVKDLFDNKVNICATLLGAFMEQQIKIPLLKHDKKHTAELLSSNSAPVAMGVWALFSSTFEELHDMLSSMEGNPLVVEIQDYIAGMLSTNSSQKQSHGSKYDGKLQFMLQACSQRVITCSSAYISYSLEHQLCSKPKFDKSLTVKELISKWGEIFKGDALSFVAASHRPLIARWLKWAMLIHDLRLSLASYTCVGVTGLVNSGKSQLINKLFGIKTQVGTLEKTRTTVPLLYNLDGIVNGLDVIDFPGVDDKENNVPKLADMLLGLAQIVVFVCDHKRIFTDQAKEWLEQLKKEDIPVILCLTFADELYLHFIGEDKENPEPTEYKRRVIGRELERKIERIGHHASRKVGFYCFHVPSGYAPEVNFENLQKMGIGTPLDVGNELVKVFEKTLKQEDVAKQLKDHMDKMSS